ncbi:MAG: histidinol phosphate phosphatase [Verrucomicrobia bacterium]|nr:MAG: histidinol phosphate phosphatase [Verrucomicrobiota bacterium]
MILPADYHMHTPLCRHAVGEPKELAAQALKVGLSEIGFSDHSPMPRDDFDEWRMRADQLGEYVAKVEAARRAHPALRIKLGLEVDYLPGYEDWIRDLASRYEWDYFIGSVHYVGGRGSRVGGGGRGEEGGQRTEGRDEGSGFRVQGAEGGMERLLKSSLTGNAGEPGWAIDSPQAISEWKRRKPYEVWSAYFERLTLAAESGLFNIIGHADLCKKFCFYPKEDCEPLFIRFLEAAKRSGTAIELNTAGLRKDCREIYPSLHILRLAAEHEVPITFGSDAHAPGEVGADFNKAMRLAREAGYDRYHRFTRRRAEETALPPRS